MTMPTKDRNVRIVVFVKDSDVYDEKAYRQMTEVQFLKGYAGSDSNPRHCESEGEPRSTPQTRP